MKQCLIALIIFAFYSCKDRFEPTKYSGIWVPIDEDERFVNTSYISFEDDSIFFSDSYTYTKQGSYKLQDEKMNIELEDETFEKSFSFRKKDSSFLFGSQRYQLITILPRDTLGRYELMNIKTKHKISGDSLAKLDSGFHIFRNANDSLRLKLNDRYSRLNHIPDFVFRTGSSHYPTHAIYLGKRTKLIDLVNCYYQLASANHLKVFLILNFNVEKNEYSILPEGIDLWEEQLQKHFDPTILEPIDADNTRESFMKKYAPEIIEINTTEDFVKLESIEDSKNYLISINSNLELEKYIVLKEQLLQIKGKMENRIRTEFIEPSQGL